MFRELFQQSGLSLERLHTFCLVVEAGGVTKAAKGDPNAQSLFSRQIRELEEFFGVELVRRSGRGRVLTSAGKRFAIIVRENLTALADFKLQCGNQPRKITIAAGDSLMRWLVLPKYNQLQARISNAAFVFLNLQSEEILRRLSEGTIDFGIVRDSGSFKTLMRVVLGVMSHSLFTGAKIKSGETFEKLLSEHPLTTLEGDGVFKSELAAVLESRGVKANIRVECSSFPLVARALKAANGTAILPIIAREEVHSEGFRELGNPSLKRLDRKIALVWSPRMLRVRGELEKAKTVLLSELKF